MAIKTWDFVNVCIDRSNSLEKVKAFYESNKDDINLHPELDQGHAFLWCLEESRLDVAKWLWSIADYSYIDFRYWYTNAIGKGDVATAAWLARRDVSKGAIFWHSSL